MNSHDKLSGIDVFVATVESGSFAAAAERQGLTRSAVAKTIARIEERLNARLFHRTTRRQSLTEDGQIYYERCLRALEELRAGEAALDSARREVAGRLRVSMPVLFGRHCVAPVLSRMATEHARLELDLSFSDRPVDLIEDGFDLVIRNGETTGGAGLKARTISLQRMTVCAAPGYLAAHGRPGTLADLLTHHAVTYGRAGRIRPWVFPVEDGKPVEVVPPSRLRFDNVEAIADAAEAGHGLAWLPCWLIRERVRMGRLVPLLEDIPRFVFHTYALWPDTRHPPLRLRLAIDALVAALPGSAEL